MNSTKFGLFQHRSVQVSEEILLKISKKIHPKTSPKQRRIFLKKSWLGRERWWDGERVEQRFQTGKMARIEFGTRVKWGCSYKRITLIVCSINIVIALYVLHCLYSSVYIYSNNNSSQDSKCLSFINLLLLLILGFHRIVSYDGSC